ncbi:hypothetical protein NL676_038519 [Syzygium grande]|nr:hypothetical protein NL676_038519 [Syzygium grande]
MGDGDQGQALVLGLAKDGSPMGVSRPSAISNYFTGVENSGSSVWDWALATCWDFQAQVPGIPEPMVWGLGRRSWDFSNPATRNLRTSTELRL